MKRTHAKTEKQWRPYMGGAYRSAMELIAAELNKTSIYTFDALSAQRHADYELWRRVFPGIQFPIEADVLRTQYHQDPGVRNTVQSGK